VQHSSPSYSTVWEPKISHTLSIFIAEDQDSTFLRNFVPTYKFTWCYNPDHLRHPYLCYLL
jgi:hypothetical protein